MELRIESEQPVDAFDHSPTGTRLNVWAERRGFGDTRRDRSDQRTCNSIRLCGNPKVQRSKAEEQ